MSTIAAGGGGEVRWFIHEPNAVERQLAEQYALVESIPLLHLRGPLPLDDRHQVPAGFVTRPFEVGVDEDEWLRVNGRAFAEHPEQSDWTHAVLAQRMAEEWFDPHGFLLHEIDGRLAGFCWTKVHRTSPPTGEIFVIGVDPAHHGRGLGRALTIAGFAHLAAQGMREGMLYTLADNTPAIKLYESLGLRLAHHDTVFTGTVAAAR